MRSPPAIFRSQTTPELRSQPFPGSPTIVAESLASVAEPLTTAWHAGPSASGAEVAAALARSLAPPQAHEEPPRWLWPAQRTAFGRTLAALEHYGGALLADPVGTGKTYVALAAAHTLQPSHRTICLVPAALREQWSRVADRLGVDIVTCSHERASRGTLSAHGGRLVIIDECHRFRNAGTHRYERVASWLTGHQTLMLSATPVVNHLADLAHQLRLAVRDDALAPHGIPSISGLLGAGQSHPALGLLVVTSAAGLHQRPRAADRSEQPLGPDGLPLLNELERLSLSPDPATAALLRCLLWRSAGSSPAALLAALRRYRRLLLHAQDAARAGQPANRRALLQLAGAAGEQLILWELLPRTDAPVDLAVSDVALLDSLIASTAAAAARDDPKLARLRDLLADGRPTLVFSVSRDTVRWLRHRLGSRVAWCTGDRAGIGPAQTTRRTVFEWFNAAAPLRRQELPEARLAPLHLVTTDVAAEGLDLQGAARVIHYDLPWTSTKLEQRRGRVLRGGSLHADVESVRFDPPPILEQRLRQLELLARKAGLPALIGLGERNGWCWRLGIARKYGEAPGVRGWAGCTAEPAGILAGFSLHRWPGREPALSSYVVWWDPKGGWTEDPDVISLRLGQSRGGEPARVGTADLRAALREVAGEVRERIRSVRHAGWEAPVLSPIARHLVERLGRLAREAARRRDARRLGTVRRALALAARGHTAGEARMLERLAGAGDGELLAAFESMAEPAPCPSAIEARITGVILFCGGLTFPRWLCSAPFSSISTAR